MALKTTRDAVKAICAADPTTKPEWVKAALAAIDGNAQAVHAIMGNDHALTTTDKSPLDRMLTPKEAARILAVSTKTITRYARLGLLRGVTMGDKRGHFHGFTAESVRALLDGRTEPSKQNPTGLMPAALTKGGEE